MQMPDRNYSSANYRYCFNGKENDKDISDGCLDFGARIYSTGLGRFFRIDRFSKKYPNFSPYLFAGNSPIAAIDVNGDSIYVMNSSGEIMNITTQSGSDFATQFGYDILMKTASGKELLEKYQNNKGHDVYITINIIESSNPNESIGALTMTPTTSKDKKIPDVGSVNKSLSPFSGKTLKNPSAKFSLMVINKKYLNAEGVFSGRDKYDFAESFFHELKCHVDLYESAFKSAMDKIRKDPSLSANANKLRGETEHTLYGVDPNSNLGISGHTPTRGSLAEKIRNEILMQKFNNEFKEIINKENKMKSDMPKPKFFIPKS